MHFRLLPPEPPGNCCMSGCANCVWLDYAEEMTTFYRSKGESIPKEKLLQEVESQITDPMIKAFILLELKSKLK